MFLNKIIFLNCMQLFVFIILQKGFKIPFSASLFIYGCWWHDPGTLKSSIRTPFISHSSFGYSQLFPQPSSPCIFNVSECFEKGALFFLIWESCSCPCKECYFQCLMEASFAIFSPSQEERLSPRRKYEIEERILFRHMRLSSPDIWSWYSRSNESSWQASTFSR